MLPEAKFPQLLLVEDDPEIRELLKKALSGYYLITVAEDGADALSAVAQGIKSVPYNLIVVDVAMRYVDGLAFVKCLRCFESHEIFPQKARVMFHTAHPDLLEDPEMLQKTGVKVEDCYVKSTDTLRLLNELKSIAGETNGG